MLKYPGERLADAGLPNVGYCISPFAGIILSRLNGYHLSRSFEQHPGNSDDEKDH
jgi:hypothetical protein